MEILLTIWTFKVHFNESESECFFWRASEDVGLLVGLLCAALSDRRVKHRLLACISATTRLLAPLVVPVRDRAVVGVSAAVSVVILSLILL